MESTPTCDLYNTAENNATRSGEFTRNRIYIFYKNIMNEMISRGCEHTYYLTEALHEMHLPRHSTINISLQYNAFKILFLCSITQLIHNGFSVSREEYMFARDIQAELIEKYNIAMDDDDGSSTYYHERRFYRRDLLPVFGSFVRGLELITYN
jgi:hypothetical protein